MTALDAYAGDFYPGYGSETSSEVGTITSLKSSSSSLVCDALSALGNCTVLPWDEYASQMDVLGNEICRGPLSISTVFQYASGASTGDSRPTSPQGTIPPPIGLSDRSFQVTLRTLTGRSIQVDVVPKETVLDLKYRVHSKEGIPPGQMRLLLNGSQLDDHETVEEFGAYPNCTIMVLERLKGGMVPVYGLRDEDVDPQFDYDFTNLTDEGLSFTRGGFPYKRPLGYKRIALKVLGRYEDDVWLGAPGFRQSCSPNEWPVSYHGTSMGNAQRIVSGGYSVAATVSLNNGRGIYSTPFIETAHPYSQKFVSSGELHGVILQNRVNPRNLRRLSPDIWLSSDENDVRAYGLCIKRVQ